MKVVASGVEIIIATPGRLNDLVEASMSPAPPLNFYFQIYILTMLISRK